MPPLVNWLGRAKEKVSSELVLQFSRELCQTFPKSDSITVFDSFQGYSGNQKAKANLAIEVHAGEAYNTHVVKLGSIREVGNDYKGWQKCFSKRAFASRIFVPVTMHILRPERDGRAAIIYQDAYTFFGPDEEAGRPEPLETIVDWAVFDDKPDPVSVERVIRQVYGDLFRWFYRNSPPDRAGAVAFYEKRLKIIKRDPRINLLSKWATEEWRAALRQDVLWVANKMGDPNEVLTQLYEDPVDYVGWALRKKNRLPQTLIGRTHGDIHGRNIIVGVRRGEAEYPAAFDYGEMGDRNVLAWDFVKLETELKVRLLKRLCPSVPDASVSTEDTDMRTIRADQLAFALRFETLLANLTERINEVADPAALCPPGGRNITGDVKMDRALGILMRIRQEAALFLGDFQPQRGKRGNWRDEYYFALAVYGVATAKFDYQKCEVTFALVSAGVAVAQMDKARTEIKEQIVPVQTLSSIPIPGGRYPYPSFRVPVVQAHRIWKGRRSTKRLRFAERLLKNAMRHYPHAMALRQEYALILAELGEYEEARSLLEPSRELCIVFADLETLSRIGRLYKDLGDIMLARDVVPVEELSAHPAFQWYASAFECYRDAFEISRNYFPGINAATLAVLLGNDLDAKTLAAEVAKTCTTITLGTLTPDERYWVLATEGEAQIVLGHPEKAVRYYKAALKLLPKGSEGMAQSTYNQVRRLHWALGERVVRRVLTLFERSSFRLKQGPL